MIFRIILFAILMSGSVFANNNQDILISTPKEVQSGEEFLLVINIPANLMEGIAKLEIEIPNGFEASVRKTANAEFTEEPNNASFRWLKFPKNQEVEVSLTVKSPQNTDGYFVIKANAYFLAQNEPVRINIEPKIFTLVNANSIDDDMLVINEKTTVTFENFKSEGIACIRQVPYLKEGEVYVNILVSKGDFNKYGKIQEKIPTGYKVVNLKSQNAIFVYNENQSQIKYMWMNLPDKEKFVVSYKLIPVQDIDESVPFLIFGKFFYADSKTTKKVEIKERGIELGNMN